MEIETSQEVTGKLSKSSLVDNSHSVSSSASPSVTERTQDDDTTTTSQSADDICTITKSMMVTFPSWRGDKGHKRSRSSTIDYSRLTAANISSATVGHRRSSSFDINLLVSISQLQLR